VSGLCQNVSQGRGRLPAIPRRSPGTALALPGLAVMGLLRATCLAAIAVLGAGCYGGCNQEMDHGGGNTDAAASSDGGASHLDAALPFCPDGGMPYDASPYDASPYDAGPSDAGPDAGPPTCQYPWDAGPDAGR
jgi:hypothetical protein